MGPMRIFYLNTPVYDYLSATVIEGLTLAGHDVRCTEAANHGRRIDDADLVPFAHSADLVVVGSGDGVRLDLLPHIHNPRLVYVDGRDQADLSLPPGVQAAAVFKRELSATYAYDPAGRVEPLPFAAEQRYLQACQAPIRDIAVSFLANLHTNPLRYSIAVRLAALGRADVMAGMTGERAYDPWSPSGNPIATPMYHQMLARSRVSINMPGAGYDCARYWEILAAGALLFTWQPDILIPNGFTDQLDCVTFTSLAEFETKLQWLLSSPAEADEIARRGHERLLAFHTSTARAEWFLERALHHVRSMVGAAS